MAGNGQSELLEALGGIARATGRITLKGVDLPLVGLAANGQTRREAGIAHVPEDRQHLGLIMDFSGLGKRGVWLSQRSEISEKRRVHG